MTEPPAPDFATPFNHPAHPLERTLAEVAPDTPLVDLPALDPRNNQNPLDDFEKQQAALKNGAAAPAPSSPPAGASAVAGGPAATIPPPPPMTPQEVPGVPPNISRDQLLAMIADLQAGQLGGTEQALTAHAEATRARQAIQLLAVALAIGAACLLLYGLKQRQLEAAAMRATMGIGE